MSYLTKNIESEEINQNNNESESIFCKVEISNSKSIIIGSVYRPPGHKVEEINKTCCEMKTIAKTKNRIGCDFNLPDIN